MSTLEKDLDELARIGFELALKYAERAQLYNLDPVKYMQEQLDNWKEASNG